MQTASAPINAEGVAYLASPYSHPDAAVRHARFDDACRAAASLTRDGRTVFSPIVHSYPIERYGLPTDWRYWERHDRKFLAVCDEVFVLMLSGWRDSVGVQAEITIAHKMGKPVTYLAPETL